MRVVLVPGNGSSEKVFECLLGWSRSGLLEPFAWRTAEPGALPTGSTPVRRVEDGEAAELLLGAALQGSAVSKDELVAFYPAVEGEGFEASFAGVATAYVELLARTIAHDPRHPARCTMVVAPSQIGQPVPPELFSQGFAANVYVAPEDRAEPRDPNRLLGNEAVFAMHAAHALATVADLWSEPDAERPSVVDILAQRQPHHQLAAQVVRCFSRGIDFGYLPDHVSSGIFHGSGGWPNPDPERFDRIDDAGAVVPHLADEYLTAFREELGPAEFRPQRLPDPEPLGLLEALRLLFHLIVMRIRRKPFEMVRQKIDSIHDAAADWVEKQAGPDSGIRVKRRGRGGERGGDRLDLDVVLEKPLVVPDGPVSEAWSALRRLVLGLVDGSELPGGIDQTRLVNGRGQRALVAEPAALAADPEAEPPPVAGFGGRICDPLHLDPELARVEDADEEGAETERRALAEWSEQHSSTLLWRVGLRIARSLRAAEAEAEAEVATQAVAGEEESTEDEQERDASSQAERRRLRRRLRNSLLLRSGVALLLAAGAIGRLNLIGIAAALAAIGVLWVLGLAGAARHWFLADEQISRREDEEELARLNAALRRSLRMGDRIRLERRYREFLDWAEAIGRLVHKPWVGDPLDRVSLSPPVDHASLPAAFSVAIAETSELGLERLSAAAGAGVFNPGWLSALYENTERLEMTEMLVRRGRAAEDAEVSRPDPAADVGKDPQGPRRQLLDAIVRGAHRSLTESDFSEDVLRYIADLEPDRVCERVAVLPTADGATAGEEIDALPPALAGFEPPTVLPQLVADLSPTVVGVVCEAGYRQLTGSGVVVGEGRIATARALVDGARSIEVVTADGRRLGAELTGTDPNAGLAVLALESTGELPSAPLPEAVTVRQGDAVVSIGRPRPELDRPAVGWGLVTSAGAAASLQVAYQGEAGAAGSPLFDLDGRLLGVHCPADAAGESAGRVTSVVPVARLQALLEGGIGSTDGAPLERADRGPGRGEAVTRASAFIDELTNVETAPALLPHHWKDADSKNETRETIPAAEEAHSGSEKLTNLVAGLAFRAPLRVLVHRVDLVAPVAVAELASFPSIEDEDPGPEEKLASTPF